MSFEAPAGTLSSNITRESLGVQTTTRRLAEVAIQFCLADVVGRRQFHPEIKCLARLLVAGKTMSPILSLMQNSPNGE